MISDFVVPNARDLFRCSLSGVILRGKKMAGRIELHWGAGLFDALLVLQPVPRVVLYKGQPEVHEVAGGKCYYTSRSGLSGAGWCKNHPAIVPVGGYRVDTLYPCGDDFKSSPYLTYGGQMLVPYVKQGVVPADWPILFRDGEVIFAFGEKLLSLFFQKEREEFTEVEIKFHFFPSTAWSWQGGRSLDLKVQVGPGLRKQLIKDALIRAFRHELLFVPEEEDLIDLRRTSIFWTRLGLFSANRALFKVAQGVCWGRYDPADLSTIECLQAVAPADTLVLSPDLYIQGGELVGSFDTKSGKRGVSRHLEISDAIKVLNGDFDGFRQEMAEVATQIPADKPGFGWRRQEFYEEETLAKFEWDWDWEEWSEVRDSFPHAPFMSKHYRNYLR